MTQTTSATTATSLTPYEEYWEYVLDVETPLDAMFDHDLFGLNRLQILQRLQDLEKQATGLWGTMLHPENWHQELREQVLDELEAANVVYVVWGSGGLNLETDEALVRFTPWAGQLVGDEWVAPFHGDVADLNHPSVAGYRKLAPDEVAQLRAWRRRVLTSESP